MAQNVTPFRLAATRAPAPGSLARLPCSPGDEHEPREGVAELANDLRFIAALEFRSFERQDFALELARDLDALAEILDSIATDQV